MPWKESVTAGGMSIDLNSCIGWGLHHRLQQREQHPGGGQDEVRRSREMHWMRIDRYYSSDMTKERAQKEGLGKIGMYLDMEVPSEALRGVHAGDVPALQPRPLRDRVSGGRHHAQQRGSQPDDLQPVHRHALLREQLPYKVRRFNWFNYVTEKFGEVNPRWDEVGRMVLNPDVTVRSRGVIEKCSMCVQRIQAGKIAAKKNGSP